MSTKQLHQNGLQDLASMQRHKVTEILESWGCFPRALIMMGPNITGIRNSVAGQTFSQNKGGAYTKAKPIPTNPRTAAQQAVRANFATNSKQWSGQLTDDQRGAWNVFAANNPYNNVFGQSKQLSGMSMMMKLNQVLAQIGVAFLPDAPADLSVDALVMPSAATFTLLDTGISALGLTTAAQTADANAKYYIFSTPALAAGKKAGTSDYRFLGAYTATAAAVTINLTAKYLAVFGAVAAAGQHISVLVSTVNVNTGATTVGQVHDTGPMDES